MTVDSILIDNPRTTAKDIDRVLSSAIRYKRPVYIELPRDKVSTPIPIYQEQHVDSSRYSKTTKEEESETDMNSMQEALAETTTMINSSKQPLIIAGVEIHRFALQNKLLQLTDNTNIPVVANKPVEFEADKPAHNSVFCTCLKCRPAIIETRTAHVMPTINGVQISSDSL